MQKYDFCGVYLNRDSLIEKTKSNRFMTWWQKFIEQMNNAENPSLESISFAYAVTGDKSLGQKALDLLRKILPNYIPLGGAKEHYPELEADLSTASACKTLAYVYSFLYPLLESADKRLLFNELRERGGGIIYKETLAGAWWGNSPNSNWNSHLHSGLGLAGLVLMEDDEEEAKKWIEIAKKTMIAMLDLAGEEGAGIEGPGYWGFCYRSVQEMVEALRNIGEINLYEHKFWDKCIDYPLYMMRPDQSGFMNFSDTGDRGLGPSHFYYAVASAKKNRLAQWFGNIIQDQGSPSIWDLLYYNPNIEPITPDKLPTDKFFKSVHISSFRSGWDKDATFFILKGGSNSWSHCHLDLNSFFIDAYGERLIVDPGADQYSLHYFTSVEPALSTSWHNTITVDGADQRQPPRYRMSFDLEEGGDAYCRLFNFASNNDMATIKGDATTAYGDYLDKFHRDITYLKPNCFVIHDNIRLKEARTQRHIQWLLHSLLPIVEDEGIIWIQGEKCKLAINPVLPKNHNYKFLTPRILMKNKTGKGINCLSIRPQWHHLWNVSPSRSPYPQWDKRANGILYGRDIEFLVVLTILQKDQPYDLIVNLISARDVNGIEIISGNITDQVFYNDSHSELKINDIKTDSEKVVVRKKDGKVLSSLLID